MTGTWWRRRSTHRAASLAALLVLALPACASLLGDFSSGHDEGGTSDAGHDAPAVGDGSVADQGGPETGGPEAGGSDAPVDTAMEGLGDDGGAIDADAGDGAPGPLDCTTWV